jgi:hypothetical protein
VHAREDKKDHIQEMRKMDIKFIYIHCLNFYEAQDGVLKMLYTTATVCLAARAPRAWWPPVGTADFERKKLKAECFYWHVYRVVHPPPRCARVPAAYYRPTIPYGDLLPTSDMSMSYPILAERRSTVYHVPSWHHPLAALEPTRTMLHPPRWNRHISGLLLGSDGT